MDSDQIVFNVITRSVQELITKQSTPKESISVVPIIPVVAVNEDPVNVQEVMKIIFKTKKDYIL